MGKKIYLLIFWIILVLIVFEFLFSYLNPILIKPSLYRQAADLELFQVSNDPNRLYELKPGSSISIKELYPLETKYTDNPKITINSYGMRGIEFNNTKQDIYRIVIVGGSNTMGPTASDENTYPAKLQKIFEEKYPNKFEIWNAGIYAYVMSQKVPYAKYIIEEYKPDLLIIQDFNTGRRGFLIDENNAHLFRKNPELYKENIPLLISNNTFLENLHYNFITISHSYRFLMININNMVIRNLVKSCIKETYWGWCELSSKEQEEKRFEIASKYRTYGDKVNNREITKFISDNPEVIIFDSTEKQYCNKEIMPYGEAYYFSLCKNKTEEYQDIHPPSYVYDHYAEELFNYLESYLIHKKIIG